MKHSLVTTSVSLKIRKDKNLRNCSDVIILHKKKSPPGFAQCLDLLTSLIMKKIIDIIYHYSLKWVVLIGQVQSTTILKYNLLISINIIYTSDWMSSVGFGVIETWTWNPSLPFHLLITQFYLWVYKQEKCMSVFQKTYVIIFIATIGMFFTIL